jgi:hypothetical protein
MALCLDSSHAKLRRASEHLKTLRTHVAAWAAECPHALIVDYNETHTEFFLILKREGPPPQVVPWALMIGDCIYNVRAALDHLVYAIACAESDQDEPPMCRALAFPIVDDPRDFDFKSPKLGKLSDKVKATIESVQPYNRPHRYFAPLLAVLRELSNNDKHRLIKPAFVTAARAKLIYICQPPVPLHSDISTDDLRDGSIVAWVKTSEPAPQLSCQIHHFDLMVAIDHQINGVDGSVLSRRSMYDDLLGHLIEEACEVTKIVSGALA